MFKMATTVQQSSHVKFPTLKEYHSAPPVQEGPGYYFGKSTDKRHLKSHNGTGKVVSTILAEQGDHVTVIADQSYQTRHPGCVSTSGRPIKGWRPMHQSTLRIPTQAHTDYLSTSKRHFEGVRSLHSDEVPHTYPSQQITQFTFSHAGIPLTAWDSGYRQTYLNTGAEPPSKLHAASVDNKFKNSRGFDVKRVLKTTAGAQSYMTKYTSVHDKVGLMRGPGVPQPRDVRRSYNPLTGADVGEGWSDQNRRVSGNRVLYQGARKEQAEPFILG